SFSLNYTRCVCHPCQIVGKEMALCEYIIRIGTRCDNEQFYPLSFRPNCTGQVPKSNGEASDVLRLAVTPCWQQQIIIALSGSVLRRPIRRIGAINIPLRACRPVRACRLQLSAPCESC